MGVGSMIFPTLVSMALKEDQHLWFVAMLAVAIFSAITIYLQFLFTRERVTEEGHVITRDAGDHGDSRGAHVGGVEPAAEAHFHHRERDLSATKREPRGERRGMSPRRSAAASAASPKAPLGGGGIR